MHNGTGLRPEPRVHVTVLMRGEEVVADPADMDRLTGQYTEEALSFLRRNRERPFFLYLAHTMPHIPLGVSEEFRDRTGQGIYADVVAELDHGVGRVLDELDELGLAERTLVIFTSDNGPWIDPYIGEHAGSAGDLRGWKMTTWEGGPRVPMIARFPGRIPAGEVRSEVAATFDFFPTFARLAGAELPGDRTLDGRDLWPLLRGEEGASSPHDALFYYAHTHLQAVRSGRWKLVLPRPPSPAWTHWYRSKIEGVPEPLLYDLVADRGETRDRFTEEPEVVERLMSHVETARRELGDYDRIGAGARFFDSGAKRPEVRYWDPGPGFDGQEPVGALHFDFEEGLEGWEVVEGQLELPRSDRPYHPVLHHRPYPRRGDHHLSTLDLRRPFGFDDGQRGVLQSPPFVLKGDRMSFLLGGGGFEDCYAALCEPDGTVLLRRGGPRKPGMERVDWDVGEWRGRRVVFRLVDRRAGAWGHLLLDDLSCEGELDGP